MTLSKDKLPPHGVPRGRVQTEQDSQDRPPEEPSDGEIIRQVLFGKVDSFELLIERYKRFVFAIVSKYLPAEAVEEVAHDVFVSAFRSLASFSDRSPFRFWLSKLAVRRSYDYWRTVKRSREIPESRLSREGTEWFARAAVAQSEEEFRAFSREQGAKETIAWALARLSSEERMVLMLVYVEGHSVKEAAALLGWTTVNVKVRAFRARAKVRALLEQLEQ